MCYVSRLPIVVACIRKESMTKNRELSREEEAELSRSKKKVKEGYHADFNDGISENGQSQGG